LATLANLLLPAVKTFAHVLLVRHYGAPEEHPAAVAGSTSVVGAAIGVQFGREASLANHSFPAAIELANEKPA